MTEQEWAARFSIEADGLLSEDERSGAGPAPAWFREILDLAGELRTLDLSADSRRRESQLPWLVRGMENRPEDLSHRRIRLGRGFWRRHPLWAGSAVVICVLLFVTLTVPGVTATGAEIVKYVRRILLGDHLTAVQLNQDYIESRQGEYDGPRFSRDDLLKGPVIIFDEDSWMFMSMGGMGSGYVPTGTEKKLRKLASIQAAEEAVSFVLLTPTYLPSGYGFREALVAPDGSAWIFYGEPAKEIIVSQAPVGPGNYVSLSTNGEVEKLTVRGSTAAWLNGDPGGVLSWESDGLVFMIQSADQSMWESIRIGESLR